MTEQRLKLRPINNNVVLKKIVGKEMKYGALYIPQNKEKHNQMYLVIAVGPGQYTFNGDLIPITVKEGETVLIGSYSGNDITFCNEEYTIVPENYITVVIE